MYDKVLELLKEKNYSELKKLLSDMNEADIASILTDVPEETLPLYTVYYRRSLRQTCL